MVFEVINSRFFSLSIKSLKSSNCNSLQARFSSYNELAGLYQPALRSVECNRKEDTIYKVSNCGHLMSYPQTVALCIICCCPELMSRMWLCWWQTRILSTPTIPVRKVKTNRHLNFSFIFFGKKPRE